MNNSEIIPRMKWTQVILVVTFILCLVGAGIISIVYFFQTESAFRPLNDSGILLGRAISFAFAFVFQYGQNVSLFMRKKFCSGKIIFRVPFFDWEVSDRACFMIVFIVFAAVDALTNVIWFYRTVETNPDPFIDATVKTLGYTGMILAVFVEEAIGGIMDALSKAMKELKSILAWEKKNHSGENNSAKRFAPAQVSANYNNRPVANAQKYSAKKESRFNDLLKGNTDNHPAWEEIDDLGKDFKKFQKAEGYD
jgi:hypothetical protein